MSASGFINIPEAGLYAIAWAGVGISGLFVAGRTCIRYQIVRKITDLNADDYWVLAAWLILLVNAILQTYQAPHLYYLVYAASGKVPAGEALLDHGNEYVRYEFAIIALFFTVLWCIKASFLSVYWRLFQDLPRWKIAWWCVVVFTFAAYVGDWVASACTCHPASVYFQFGECTKPIDQRGSTISIAYSTTVDVLTDVMIILLPVSLLWNLQVTARAKAGLFAIFSLALIVIIIAIIRAVEINGRARSDPVWLATWSLIESSISVIVGCLPAFKSLFKLLRERSSPSNSRQKRQLETYGQRSSGRRSDFLRLDASTTSNTSRDIEEENGIATPLEPIAVHTEVWYSQEESKDPKDQADMLGFINFDKAKQSPESH